MDKWDAIIKLCEKQFYLNIGEDGEEQSAAGQMDTILGVKGYTELCQAVLKCWASHFSFLAVQYKR